MATRRPPLGVNHLTIVPANFEGDDGADGEDAEGAADAETDDGD
ncbi:hypothetical protein [Halomicrobium salinisoli]|nr:hypothetical protein [Halomicrobium salinisoli]